MLYLLRRSTGKFEIIMFFFVELNIWLLVLFTFESINTLTSPAKSKLSYANAIKIIFTVLKEIDHIFHLQYNVVHYLKNMLRSSIKVLINMKLYPLTQIKGNTI